MIRIAAILALALGVPSATATGQEALFFSLEGEGTAYVVIDSPAQVAYLTDGGRDGQAGVLGARVEGKSALGYLLGRELERLVITCTHPHRDHFGGLETLICEDDQILAFRQLVFIDTPDSHGAAESLAGVFRRCRGSALGPEVRHVSAAGRDAFAALQLRMESVRVSNFSYEADSVGTHPHDRTIITRYEIGAGGSMRTVLDFDDASSRLIARWASAHPEASIDALVVAHHGSRYNDLSPIFATGSQVGRVIFTVNRDNRHFHPSPQVVAQFVERLGAENVFVTDSTIGRNVRLTPGGLAYGDGTSPREALADFLQAQIVRLDGVRRMAQTALRGRAASVPEASDLLATLDSGRLLDEHQVKRAQASAWLLASEARHLRLAADGIPILTEVLAGLAEVRGELLEPSEAPRWPAAVTRAAEQVGVAVGDGSPSPALPERATLMTLDGYAPRGRSWSPSRVTWSYAMERGAALGLVILPPAGSFPSCAELADPSDRIACELAEGWPTRSRAEQAMLIFAPSDLVLVRKLQRAVTANGMRALLVGPHLKGDGVLRDVSLATELMEHTASLAVLDTPSLRGSDGITIERHCAALLTARTRSRWAVRFVERRQAQGGEE